MESNLKEVLAKSLIMKYLLIFILSINSCNSQSILDKSAEEQEIITIFLNSIKPYSYVSDKIKGLNLQNDFIQSYKASNNHFKKVDSICNNSIDTTQLKIFCPAAESLLKFNNLLNQNDLNLIKESYDKVKERTINIDKIIRNTTLKKHSNAYDSNVVGQNLNEFPSVEILNIYFSKNNQVAIIAYDIYYGTLRHGTPNYYVLKKINNIWWKSLGNI